MTGVWPTEAEVAALLPGDGRVAANVVMDRAFDLAVGPHEVWPWLVQIGKGRAGWYFPRWVERFIAPGRRATRRIEPDLQRLDVGQVIGDWGGRGATLTVAEVLPERVLLFWSRRKSLEMTWVLVLTATTGGTRVHSRVRLGPVRRQRLARSVGGQFDRATIAGLAAGLRERIGAT